MLLLIAWGCFLLGARETSAHGVGGDLAHDPELLRGWETWLHLSLQWLHLVSSGLLIGGTLGVALLGVRGRCNEILMWMWVLLLLFLVTGSHNMEYSTSLSRTPSILDRTELDTTPYGWPYFLLLSMKIALYWIAVLFVLIVNISFLNVKEAKKKVTLFRIYLFGGGALALALTFLVAVILFYHEVVDLWPIPPHSMGGVVGPAEGTSPLAREVAPAGVPNDFGLLTTGAAWLDIVSRWMHLVGFGLLLGGTAVSMRFREVHLRRFLSLTWTALGVQVTSGLFNMARWTPFAISPWIWNLGGLSHLRLGRTYALLLAIKLVLVAVLLLSNVGLTVWWRRRAPLERHSALIPPLFLWIFLLIIMGSAYVMVMVLLVHEGVDHAL